MKIFTPFVIVELERPIRERIGQAGWALPLKSIPRVDVYEPRYASRRNWADSSGGVGLM